MHALALLHGKYSQAENSAFRSLGGGRVRWREKWWEGWRKKERERGREKEREKTRDEGGGREVDPVWMTCS